MNHRACTLLMLIVLFVGSATIHAQTLSHQIDELLATRFSPDEPGAAILVARGEDILYQKGMGLANVELRVPMEPDMVFQIGSITKQFTAISILMLMEQGKLKLEDDITRYIPDYPTYGKPISIHHLLTHTSGIKNYTSLQKWTKVWRQDFTPEELIKFFRDEPMDFAPGENFVYSNSDYIILGFIIEKASGQTYESFVENELFKPLGMNSSYYGHATEIIPRRASGYQRDREYQNAEYLSMTQPYAAGSLMSTVKDLYTWNRALHQYRLVKKESLEKAFTNYTLPNGKRINYGYGWSLNEINGSKTLEHNGGIFGFVADAVYLPVEDVFVAIFANCDCMTDQTLAQRIAALTIGKPIPQAKDAIQLSAADLEPYVGVYDFDDSATRIITLEGNQLHSQRPGGTRFKIYPVQPDLFVFENSMSTLRLTREGNTVKALFANRIDKTEGMKTNKPIPVQTEMVVEADLLQRYAGVYELMPEFLLNVMVEEGKLMAQATGQPKLELYAETETRFFLKVVEAQIEFFPDDAGSYSSLILYQGGMEIPGKKKS